MSVILVLLIVVSVALVGTLVAALVLLRPSRRRAVGASAASTMDRFEWMDRAGALADDLDVLLATAPAMPAGPVTDNALRHHVAEIEVGLRAIAGLDAGELGPVAAKAAIAVRSWHTAFEALAMMRRGEQATAMQVQTAEGLVTARTNELRSAVASLRHPPAAAS